MSGALKINPDFEYTTQRYPSDLIINDQTDYIRFQFFKYRPPFKTLAEDNETNYFKTDGKRVAYYGLTDEGNIGEKLDDDILMYMPQDVSTSMSTSWGGKEISNTAAIALRAYANLTSGDAGAAIQAVGSGVPGFTKGLPSSVAAGLVNMGLNATGAQTNLTMNDILGGTAGVITNPNTEMLFGGPSIRNIGFKFKMAARSEREAKNMLTICRRFQYHASAAFGGDSPIISGVVKGLSNFGNATKEKKDKTKISNKDIKNYGTNTNNFISVPDLCLFKYMTGNNVNTYLNQYKACALTNVDVNFTPDGSYSTLVGGYPSAVELTIGLVETKIIYQGEIDTNYKGESN